VVRSRVDLRRRMNAMVEFRSARVVMVAILAANIFRAVGASLAAMLSMLATASRPYLAAIDRGIAVNDPPVPSGRSVAVYLGIFASVGLALFLAYNELLRPAMGDILFWQAIGKYHVQFGHWTSLLNADPMQGMFDTFPQAYRGSPLLHALYSLPLQPSRIYALLHAVLGLFVALSTYVLARSASAPGGAALIAAILLPIATFPILFTYTGVVTHIFTLTINYAYVQSAILLAIGLYWMVGERMDARFFASALFGLFILAMVCNALVLHVTLYIPVVIAFGIGALFASRNAAQLRARIVWAAIVATGLIALGFPHYVLSIGSDIAYRFFFDDLNDFTQFWTPQLGDFQRDLSHVLSLEGNPKGTTAAIASMLGLACTLYYAVLGGCGNFRSFARSFLALIIITIAAVFISHFSLALTGYIYRGPNAYHMVQVFWPFHAIMIGRSLHDIGIAVVRLFTGGKSRRSERLLVHGLVVAMLALMIPGLVPLMNAGRLELQFLDFDTHIRHTRMTNFLSDEIGIKTGATFKGTYNNFLGFDQRTAENSNLGDVTTSVAYQLTKRTGSDLTRHGLWMLGIPTLTQESVMVTAQFHRMISEFLTRPDDRQIRSFAIPTQPVEKILELWGVRFILADRKLPFGKVVMTEAVDRSTTGGQLGAPKRFGDPIQLHELQGANRGDYSPTRVEFAVNASQIIAKMRNTDFNGRETVIVTEDLPGSFSPARDTRMIVREGGFDLTAHSDGESLLVLPVQFSHCWRVSGKGNARIFRANLMQLGIRFRGQLDAQVRQSFGPLWNSGCRFRNGADMERLEIGDRTTHEFVERSEKNFVPMADQLHKSVGASHIVSFAASEDPDTYLVTAEGPMGEHYVSQKLQVEPAMYRLELLVKPAGTRNIRLQMHAADGNGSIVDFYLTAGKTVPYFVGEKLPGHADIELLENGWAKIGLSSQVKTDSLTWLLQLRDNWGRVGFTPRKEAVLVKNFRLVRGEIMPRSDLR